MVLVEHFEAVGGHPRDAGVFLYHFGCTGCLEFLSSLKDFALGKYSLFWYGKYFLSKPSLSMKGDIAEVGWKDGAELFSYSFRMDLTSPTTAAILGRVWVFLMDSSLSFPFSGGSSGEGS